MGEESKRLEDLIASVADGAAIDWQALDDEIGADEALRRVLRDLRTIAGVAKVHRSPAGVGDEPNAIDGEPTVDHGPGADASRHISVADQAGGDGRRWGHLLLMRKIGEGSFGEVFHARDTWLDHAVALKLLKPHLINRSKLLHEARTLAQIRHENVVRVHGADVHDGRVGFWMEFVQGHTLAEVVAREGVRSANEAAVMGQELCRALAAVHGKNIVHRDIKAKNVMREFDTGRVVLMDFGAGEPMKAGPPGGHLTGTPLYLAPELFQREPASSQSDIYALGVLLFYLVTGTYPVLGTSLEDLVLAHERGDRRRLGDIRPDLPDAFVRVVEKMLSVDPTRRFTTAATARAALDEVVAPASPVRAEGQQGAGPRFDAALRPVLFWSAGIAMAIACVTIFGLLSTASFNLTFGRRDGFGAEPPFQWFVWGLRSLVSPIVRIGIALAVLTLIVAAARVVSRLVPSVGAATSRWRGAVEAFGRQRGLDDPSLQLQAVAGTGVLVLTALAWAFWGPVTAFATYINDAPTQQLAELQPAHSLQYDAYARFLELFLLVYGSAAFAVYRGRRADTPVPRGVAVAAMAVPVLALVLLRALPYRVVYQNEFERVDLEDARCYEIGARQGEILLHCPDLAPPRNLVVSSTDPRLRPRGFVESVFTPSGQSQTVR